MGEVVLAESAGFCFGVERAVNTVYELLDRDGGNIYTYGPIIHNESVVQDLAEKGVTILRGEAELAAAEPGTVVIRSHGVSRREQEKMEELGYRVVDATCPFVKKIHKLAEGAEKEGRTVLIIGDKNHPEVQGICGWCVKKPYVVETEDEIDSLPAYNSYLVLSQTTFNQKKFNKIVAKLVKKEYNTYVVNTICNATQRRQSEAEEISARVDSMIVIGGSESSNTRKLYEICKAHCANTFYIQTLVDLCNLGFQPVRSVGITAGASTPKKIIEEVQSYVRSKL